MYTYIYIHIHTYIFHKQIHLEIWPWGPWGSLKPSPKPPTTKPGAAPVRPRSRPRALRGMARGWKSHGIFGIWWGSLWLEKQRHNDSWKLFGYFSRTLRIFFWQVVLLGVLIPLQERTVRQTDLVLGCLGWVPCISWGHQLIETWWWNGGTLNSQLKINIFGQENQCLAVPKCRICPFYPLAFIVFLVLLHY